jgi:predicted transcriptional regulator
MNRKLTRPVQPIGVKIDKELHTKLKEHAAITSQPYVVVLESSIREYLDKHLAEEFACLR